MNDLNSVLNSNSGVAVFIESVSKRRLVRAVKHSQRVLVRLLLRMFRRFMLDVLYNDSSNYATMRRLQLNYLQLFRFSRFMLRHRLRWWWAYKNNLSSIMQFMSDRNYYSRDHYNDHASNDYETVCGHKFQLPILGELLR